MTSAFPTKYVKKEDPEYQKLPWYQFVLIPGKQGSTVNEYRRASNSLRAALESQRALRVCLTYPSQWERTDSWISEGRGVTYHLPE